MKTNILNKLKKKFKISKVRHKKQNRFYKKIKLPKLPKINVDKLKLKFKKKAKPIITEKEKTENLIRSLALKKYQRLNLKINKGKNFGKYGEDKREAYFKSICIMEAISDVCKINQWSEKKDWQKHHINMDANFKNFLDASEAYSEVLMHHQKKFFDERTRKNRGR